jgi:hypothetical protein
MTKRMIRVIAAGLIVVLCGSGCAIVYNKHTTEKGKDGEWVDIREWGLLGGLVPLYKRTDSEPVAPQPEPENTDAK